MEWPSSVVCTVDQCNDTGAIQLTGGSSSDEGRVEICYNGVWGTITSSAWSASEAVVICGQLGYSSFSKSEPVVINKHYID